LRKSGRKNPTIRIKGKIIAIKITMDRKWQANPKNVRNALIGYGTIKFFAFTKY
jgi:hypothetical protein